VKNRIYTTLFFVTCLAFSVTGHTQTKPLSKHIPTHTHTATNLQPTLKKTTSSITTKPHLIGTKATILPKPAAPKKTISTATKLITAKKITTSNKSVPIKSVIVPEKSKTTKHAKTSSKFKQVIQYVTPTPNSRKRTIISSKTIESVTLKSSQHRELSPHILDSPAIPAPDNSNQIIHPKNDKTFRPAFINPTQSTKINTAHVSIETSLFLDGLEADLSKELILQLIDIFAWDIDFATNLRPGDQFTIIYGKKLIGGKETDTDEIIAAEFINQGTPYTAVRYINSTNIVSYYTPNGESMQRAFLTTPVDFIKISSPFDMNRMHPILNRIRAHKGIDYAARIGTPVKTTGDGVVSFTGSKGAYGQVVIIQHNDHYETLYAHMSGFRKGLTVGNHVKQGDVIGFVGQSGLATGPHLHYEFHVDGIYRDPDSVKIPHTMPISASLLTDFKEQTQPFFTQLNQTKDQNLFTKSHLPRPYIAPDVVQPTAPAQQPLYDND
jgi:murein DD-endopeptidase MepM/ murein hydrolase activator NlpD